MISEAMSLENYGLEARVFGELVKLGINQDTADQVAQAVAGAMQSASRPAASEDVVEEAKEAIEARMELNGGAYRCDAADYARAALAALPRTDDALSRDALVEAAQELIDAIDSVDDEAEYTKEEWAALGSAKLHAEDRLRAALQGGNHGR